MVYTVHSRYSSDYAANALLPPRFHAMRHTTPVMPLSLSLFLLLPSLFGCCWFVVQQHFAMEAVVASGSVGMEMEIEQKYVEIGEILWEKEDIFWQCKQK